jgi:UDP-glucuronate 4-epimerase
MRGDCDCFWLWGAFSMQLGDVPAMVADVEDLSRDVGFRPNTSIEQGIRSFVDWSRDFYRA